MPEPEWGRNDRDYRSYLCSSGNWGTHPKRLKYTESERDSIERVFVLEIQEQEADRQK
jgi:hypothetical protein